MQYPRRPIHRCAVVLVAAVACACSWALAAPMSAHAGGLGLTYVSSQPDYQGWAYVVGPLDLDAALDQSSKRSIPAYRWTGSSWVRASRPEYSQAYVWPWGSGWSWTWTQGQGWLAMRQQDLLLI